MNNLDNLLVDFELFLREVNANLLENNQHRKILLRIYEYLNDLQKLDKEDKVEQLSRIITESIVNKISLKELTQEISILKQELAEIKKILLNNTQTENITTLVSLPPENNQEQSTKISSLTELLDIELNPREKESDIWYMGLDFGTLGMSAVLLNVNQKRQYPLSWSLKNLDGLITEQYRFPSLVYRSTINNSFILGVEDIPQETDIVIDNYKAYLDWSIYGESELLENIFQLLPKLFLNLHNVTNPDLSPSSLKEALGKLQGIIVNFPCNWSDTYQFNLREAILQSHLVEDAGQIFFLEEAIASILGKFGEEHLSTGWTIVINGGNCTTEIGLVNLRGDWRELSYTDFKLTSLAYGQRCLEQDIFTQFIYPIYIQEIPRINTEIPTPGKEEDFKRYQLDQYLQTYPFAYSFLEAARLISLMLQDSAVFNLPLGDYTCVVKSQDLEKIVVNPFLRDLEEIEQQLLKQNNISSREVVQVICGGGLSLGIKKYLVNSLGRQFPQAKIIVEDEQENSIRVAKGLAYLPLFPQILARSRHQYSDYFLLKELLDVLSKDLFTIEELMQKLANKGINTRVCTQRLLALLQGKFPSGIIITGFSGRKSLIFGAQSSYYRVNSELRDYLDELLHQIFSQSIQQMSEPLLINLPYEYS